MRHRYIFCGLVYGTDKVSDFRLISDITKYNLGDCVRVNIPDDMELNHYPGDGYSTVYYDDRTLDEVGWDCYILYKGRWRKFNYLKQFKPCDWWRVLEYMFSLNRCGDKVGWTDNEEEYRQYLKDGYSGKVPFKEENQMKFPRFKEDKKGLNLELKLKEFPFTAVDEDWFKIYKELVEKYK
ncbi:MAG: hypothetical protein IJH39_05670 [Clostridia bacterium]|nr:hypothetical protein [Clostridia bacterium]